MKKIINTSKAPQAIGPYSQAIETNGFIFTSGIIPINPETNELVLGSIEEQTNLVLKNLIGLLEDCGSSANNIIKTTLFIKNMEDFTKINEIYATYFSENFPARSCVEVAALPKNVLIEIEAVATKKEINYNTYKTW